MHISRQCACSSVLQVWLNSHCWVWCEQTQVSCWRALTPGSGLLHSPFPCNVKAKQQEPSVLPFPHTSIESTERGKSGIIFWFLFYFLPKLASDEIVDFQQYNVKAPSPPPLPPTPCILQPCACIFSHADVFIMNIAYCIFCFAATQLSFALISLGILRDTSIFKER